MVRICRESSNLIRRMPARKSYRNDTQLCNCNSLPSFAQTWRSKGSPASSILRAVVIWILLAISLVIFISEYSRGLASLKADNTSPWQGAPSELDTS